LEENTALRAKLATLQQQCHEQLESENRILHQQIQQLSNPGLITPISDDPFGSQFDDEFGHLFDDTFTPSPDAGNVQISGDIAVTTTTALPPSNINLPPIKAYSTRQEALDDVNQWAFSRGYALSNAPSKKKKGSGRVKAIFGCVLREPALQPGPKKDKGKGHNKSSSGTTCKYSVICIQSLDQRT